MYIESPQNVRVRAWSQLKSKKGRTRDGLFLVEGRRLIDELTASTYDIEVLLWNVATDEPPEHLRQHQKIRRHVYELSPAAFAQVSDTSTSQGLIAVASMPKELHAPPTSSCAVLLDGVQDPGNVGTLLRSCEAFGFLSVCCGTNTVDPFSPKVVRAAMGGMFRLELSTEQSLSYIEQWQRAYPNGQVVVTAAESDELCYLADMGKPTLLIIGSEAFGASDAVRNQADKSVAIPMTATTESLNAAVAGSILLYEVYRQRRLS